MKRQLTGTVVSDRMEKTRSVEVTRNVRHPLYKKLFRVSRRFFAHDHQNMSKIGDVVIIEERRPFSARKRWSVVAVVKPAGSAGQVVPSSPEATPPAAKKKDKKESA